MYICVLFSPWQSTKYFAHYLTGEKWHLVITRELPTIKFSWYSYPVTTYWLVTVWNHLNPNQNRLINHLSDFSYTSYSWHTHACHLIQWAQEDKPCQSKETLLVFVGDTCKKKGHAYIGWLASKKCRTLSIPIIMYMKWSNLTHKHISRTIPPYRNEITRRCLH